MAIDVVTRTSPDRLSLAAAEALLTRTFESPAEVLETVRQLFGDHGTHNDLVDDRIVSIAARAGGVAAREMYLIDVSRDLLDSAIRAARRLDDRELEGLATMSLAATASYGGTDAEAFELMDRAQGLLTGENLALALNQRAGLLQRSARYHEALDAFSEALLVAPSVGVATLAGEILQNRGVLFGYLGEIDNGVADTTRAAAVFELAGWSKRHADMIHNLGWLAGRRGDLVESLRLFDEAAERYRALGIASTALAPDRCETLVAAGLLDEAATALNHWIAAYEADGNDIGLGEALVFLSRLESARCNVAEAQRYAAWAGDVFESCGRPPWVAVARSLYLGAVSWASNSPATEFAANVSEALALTEPLRSAGLGGAADEAMIVAAELAILGGEPQRAVTITSSLSHSLGKVHGASLALRVAFVNASAQVASGSARAAFDTGMAALHEYYAATPLLGGTELRAHTGVRAERLGALCVALAIELDDPHALLVAVEIQRANALACAPVLSPSDDILARLLNEHRALHAELVGEQRVANAAQHRRAESLRAEIQRRSRHVRGTESAAFAMPTIDALAKRAVVSRSVIIEIVSSEDALIALTIDGAGAWIVRLASTVTDVRSAMARMTRALDVEVRAEAAIRLRPDDLAMHRRRDSAQLAGVGIAAELSAALFDPIIAQVPLDRADTTVVIVPPAWMGPLPWATLTALSNTAFVVAPSVRLWLSHLDGGGDGGDGGGGGGGAPANSAFTPTATVVVGPQIALGAAEAEAVRGSLDATLMLTDQAATVEAVLEAMSRSTVVHVACHATFRSDNPMFSSLRLADGSLFLYDLERRASRASIVVLSACHAALGVDRPGDELIGLVAVLLSQGTNSVIASVAPVDDSPQTVAAMGALHANLAAGMPAASALHHARREHRALRAFVCFGAGTASLVDQRNVTATPTR